jgi:hypothetical protein
MANSDQENAVAPIFATARECGFAWIDLDHLSIAALPCFLKQSGYLISRTVLTVNNHAQRTVKQTLSGIYGNTSFPYHTDYSFLPLRRQCDEYKEIPVPVHTNLPFMVFREITKTLARIGLKS